MIKNHTHNNDSGSIHYIFKKILDLGIIKEAFTIIPLFFKSYAFPYKLCKYEMFVKNDQKCPSKVIVCSGRRFWNFIQDLKVASFI